MCSKTRAEVDEQVIRSKSVPAKSRLSPAPGRAGGTFPTLGNQFDQEPGRFSLHHARKVSLHP